MSGRSSRWALLAVAALVLLGALLVTLGASGGGAGPSSGEKNGELAAGASDDRTTAARALGAADVTRRESSREVADEAACVLEGFRAQGDCVLTRSGYLDLSGRVWGCVVQGAGWSEVCVVSSSESGSEVIVFRMDADDVCAELGGT